MTGLGLSVAARQLSLSLHGLHTGDLLHKEKRKGPLVPKEAFASYEDSRHYLLNAAL